ncbi:hypothetical protein [Roseovarius sp. 2305UL8-3]|uniref:hypothetical protein n=1 Tax=Roseovarius conchicola TaxID=3121636 RepID=UPI003528281F
MSNQQTPSDRNVRPRAGSPFKVPWTYSGLLDDVVFRHRITPEVDADFFNRSILRNLFFSGRVFLNDGYLVNHPSALRQIDNDGSVLNHMIGQSFISLLVRQPDPDAFAMNPEKMAAQGIKSFESLVNDPDWPQMRRRLVKWADAIYAQANVQLWPEVQMNFGFIKLFNRIFDKTLDDLGLDGVEGFDIATFKSRYEAHPAYPKGPRTAVEEVLLEMVRENSLRSEDVPLIMDIANQCYHYNFAMCLTDQIKEPVVADTTIGLAFEDILELDQTIEAEILNTPVLAVPKGFPVHDGSVFASFLLPQSEVSQAKYEFLSEMEKIFRPGTNANATEQARIVQDATEQYRSRLKTHFANLVGLSDWAPRRSSLITFGLGKLGGAVGADNIMLAANLATSNRASSFVHRMTRPIREHLLDVAFDPNSGVKNRFRFKVGDIAPRFASLAFTPDAVRNHVSDLPLITQEGAA